LGLEASHKSGSWGAWRVYRACVEKSLESRKEQDCTCLHWLGGWFIEAWSTWGTRVKNSGDIELILAYMCTGREHSIRLHLHALAYWTCRLDTLCIWNVIHNTYIRIGACHHPQSLRACWMREGKKKKKKGKAKEKKTGEINFSSHKGKRAWKMDGGHGHATTIAATTCTSPCSPIPPASRWLFVKPANHATSAAPPPMSPPLDFPRTRLLHVPMRPEQFDPGLHERSAA
jgi:hypothetical protein